MRDKVYIVARSRLEANQYAANEGLSRGDFQVVSEVGQVRAARHGEIRLLPGWDRHPRRHALRAALRFARVPVVDTAAAEEQTPVVPDDFPVRFMLGMGQDSTGLDPGLAAAIEALENEGGAPSPSLETHVIEDASGHQVAIPADLAASVRPEVAPVPTADENPDFGVLSEDEPSGTSEPSEDPAPTEEPKVNRRRSRCKACDQLHYKGDPCPEGDE